MCCTWILNTKYLFIDQVNQDGVVSECIKDNYESTHNLNEQIQVVKEHSINYFNPSIVDLVHLVSSQQSLKKSDDYIEFENFQKGLNEGKCIRDIKID